MNTTVGRMDYTYTTPGQPGYEANKHLTDAFGIDGSFEPTVAALTLPAGQGMGTPAGQALAEQVFAAAPRAGLLAYADYANTHNPTLVSADRQTTWVISRPDRAGTVRRGTTRDVPRGRRLRPAAGRRRWAGRGRGRGPSVLIEVAIGGALALLVLLVVYGSATAVVPLLTAVPAIPVTFLCVLGFTTVTPLSYFLQYLIACAGLGIAARRTRWPGHRSGRRCRGDPRSAPWARVLRVWAGV